MQEECNNKKKFEIQSLKSLRVTPHYNSRVLYNRQRGTELESGMKTKRAIRKVKGFVSDSQLD